MRFHNRPKGLIRRILSACFFFFAASAATAQTPTFTPTAAPACFQNLTEVPTIVAEAAPQMGVDPFQDKIYLGDSQASKIYVYTSGLLPPVSIGNSGEFNKIEAVQVGPDGLLYVGEDAGQKVQVVDPVSGESLAAVPLQGPGRGLFVDSKGDIYACSLGQPIELFQRQDSCGVPAFDGGNFINMTGDPHPSPVINNVWGEAGSLYVFETSASIGVLAKFNQVSTFTYSYNSDVGVSGPQTLINPGSMAKDFGGTYYVLSTGDGALFAYDSSFNVLNRFQTGSFIATSSLGVDKDGHIFVEESPGNLAVLSQTCFSLGAPPSTATPVPTCSNTPTATSATSPTVTPTLTITWTPTFTQTASLPIPLRGGSIPSYVYPDPVPHGPAHLAYFLKGPASVQIRIYNAAAELVETLPAEGSSGTNSIPLDLSRYAHGIYYCVIRSSNGDVSDPVKFAVIGP